MNCKYSSKLLLFEARLLYLTYKRFTNVIDGYLSIDNICIPLWLSKKHLLLIEKYCVDDAQQDIYIEKVLREALNADQLRSQLLWGIDSKNKEVLSIIDNTIIKKSYNLSCLRINND